MQKLKDVMKDRPRMWEALCRRLDDSRPLVHGKRVFLRDMLVDDEMAARVRQVIEVADFHWKRVSSSHLYYENRWMDALWGDIEWAHAEGKAVFVDGVDGE